MKNNINYDCNMLCTYKYFEKEDSDIAHICYQTQLLQVFKMNEFDDKILENNIKNLYSCVKNSDKIQEIIMFLSNDMSQEIFNLFNNKDSSTNIDEFSIFQILFSYEYFDIFHQDVSKYLKSLENNNILTDTFINIANKVKGN